MKNKSKALFFLATGLMLMNQVQAQESVNTSGAEAAGSGGSLSYSIGQIVYTTNTGTTGSVTQGVQHAYEITPLGVKETTLAISLHVFPNPTANYLTLQIEDDNDEQLLYQLYDVQGKQLKSHEIIAQKTHVDMSNFPVATYFLTITTKENKTVQSFKIMKK